MKSSAIFLVSSDQLAKAVGYKSASPAFRHWCQLLNITPVPGRKNTYDPALVRQRLDEAQGLAGCRPPSPETFTYPGPLSPFEQRRLRKAAEAEKAKKK